MTLLQLFLFTVQNGLFLICRALRVDYWKDSCREGPGMALLRPGLGGQGPHLEEAHIFWHADYPRLGTGSACWDQSFLSGRLAVTILHDLDSPGFLHSGPRSNSQWGKV